MRLTSIAVVFCIFGLANTLQAQNRFMSKLSIGTDGIQLQTDLKAFNKVNYVGEIGIAVEGIDIKLNDFLIGVGLNYEIVNKEKNMLSAGFTTGLTYVNHELFNSGVYYFSPQFRYNRFLGTKRNHGVSINVGYKFGSSNYKLSNENEFFKTEMIQTYKLQPIIFNLGYCIRF